MRDRHRCPASICLVVIGLFACSCAVEPRPAVGPVGEIGLISRLAWEDERVAEIRGLLEREISVVREEPAFTVVPARAGEARNGRVHLLLLDLTVADDRRMTAALLSSTERDRLSRLPAAHRFFRDIWASGQVVLLIHAAGSEELRRHLAREGEEIYDRLSDLFLDALRDGLFAGGEQERLEERIAESHGFHLRVPPGYFLEDGVGYAQIKRVVTEEPKRWLLVHYGKVGDAPRIPDEWCRLRDRVLDRSRSRSGDRVVPERTIASKDQFQGHSCTLLEGIWQNDRYRMGGPFRSYGFVVGDRYYLIDLAVFHPPAPKLPPLRQLMAIARTFEA